MFQFTDQNDMDFLEVRFYTGIFLFFISIVGAATNCAHLIHYVTIYTEDIFCALISLIFFSEVVEFIHLVSLSINEIKLANSFLARRAQQY